MGPQVTTAMLIFILLHDLNIYKCLQTQTEQYFLDPSPSTFALFCTRLTTTDISLRFQTN